MRACYVSGLRVEKLLLAECCFTAYGSGVCGGPALLLGGNSPGPGGEGEIGRGGGDGSGTLWPPPFIHLSVSPASTTAHR